jgi:hypothetical protein
MRRAGPGLLALALLFLAGAEARAAQWEPGQLEVPAGVSNAALGVSGRAASVDGTGMIHLAYQAVTGDLQNILYTSRAPSGDWTAPIPVSAPDRDGRNAATVVDALGRLHVFWEDRADAEADDANIRHRVREIDGTWLTAEEIFPAMGASLRPVAASDPFGRVHLVWSDDRFSPQTLQTRIVYTVQVDGVWSPLEVLSPGVDGATSAKIDADGLGRVHIVWSELGPGDKNTLVPEILYLRIDPDVPPGQVSVTHLVKTSYPVSSPYLAVMEDGTIHLVWLDGRDATNSGFSEIYYRRFLPDIGWGKDKRFTYDGTTHLRPLIVKGAEGTLNVVWEDYRQGNPEIYYRQITWETGWDRSPTRLTTDSSTSRTPSLVATESGDLVLFWTDTEAGGDSRILTKVGSVR